MNLSELGPLRNQQRLQVLLYALLCVKTDRIGGAILHA